jgi:hypothetical protein
MAGKKSRYKFEGKRGESLARSGVVDAVLLDNDTTPTGTNLYLMWGDVDNFLAPDAKCWGNLDDNYGQLDRAYQLDYMMGIEMDDGNSGIPENIRADALYAVAKAWAILDARRGVKRDTKKAKRA